MVVRAKQGGQGRVKGGRVGAQIGSGSTPIIPAFQADFTQLTSLPAQISFTRASTATYFDSSGTLQVAAIDAPRFDHDRSTLAQKGFLVEPQTRTNLFLATASPANQTITVVNATSYTVSFYGTGSMTLTGAVSHTVTGISSTARTSYSFTSATTSLVIAISGSVQYPNVEAGDFATSHIPTTTVPVTRSPDIVQFAGTAQTVFTGSACTVLMEIDAPVEGDILSGAYFYANFLRDSTGGGAAALRHYGNTIDGIDSHAPDGSAIHTTLLSGDLTTPFRTGIAFDATGRSISGNGSTAVSAAPVVGQTTPIYLGYPQTGIAAGLNTCLRKIEMYSSRLSDALLATFTKMDSPNGVAWGDSLTAGFNASSAAAAYPQVLTGLLGRDVGNGGVGGETSTQITTRALADIIRANRIALIWMGLNDTDGNSANTSAIISTILSNITSVINHMSGQTQRFAVMSLLTGDTEFPGATAPGDGFYTQKLAINSALASAYPSNYLDIRSLLISASGGTYFPGASYRSDTIHLNDTGYAYVAAQVKAFINSKGW
jgi:lysophospholipase L1-like esterase